MEARNSNKLADEIDTLIDSLDKNVMATNRVAVSQSYGNPGPIGLAGFAMTTFVLSVFNAGVFIDKKLEPVVLPLALFYGGLAQFIAGFFELVVRNTFGALAFCSYGSFWLSFATYFQYFKPKLEATEGVHEYNARGLYLLAWSIFTLYLFVASIKISKIIMAVLFFLLITFIILTVGALDKDNETVDRVGGWFGLVTAFLAWYASFAMVANAALGRDLIPIGHGGIVEFGIFKRWSREDKAESQRMSNYHTPRKGAAINE